MKSRILAASLFVLVLLGSFPESARATTVRDVNLEDMVRYADRIFWGRCLSVETLSTSGNGMTIREYHFRVADGIKGVETGETLTFRQVLGFPARVAGVPQYQKGQQVLLFLHGDSRLGLTSPVGMHQGTFSVTRLEDGEPAFLNTLENKNLSKGFESRSASDLGITNREMEILRSGQPLRLSDLRELVSKINQAIQ
jgi:hypothetical protein